MFWDHINLITNSEVLKEPGFADRNHEEKITYREAIIEALYQEMKQDNRVPLCGEDIADYGGTFGAIEGLFEIFGRDRVFNTPISESAIIGAGTGAAMRGLRHILVKSQNLHAESLSHISNFHTYGTKAFSLIILDQRAYRYRSPCPKSLHTLTSNALHK